MATRSGTAPKLAEGLQAFTLTAVACALSTAPVILLAQVSWGDLSLWFANIVAILLIAARERALFWPGLLGAGIGLYIGTAITGVPGQVAAISTVANLVDVGVSSALLHRFVPGWPWTQRQLRDCILLCLLGGLPLSAPLGGYMLHQGFELSFAGGVYSWCAARAVAVLFLMPAAWCLSTLGPDEPDAAWHSPALWTVTLGVTLAVFFVQLPPLIFMPLITLTWFGMYKLPRQGTLAMLAVGAIAAVASHTGQGPVNMVADVDDGVRILILQAYLLTLGLIVLPPSQHDAEVRETLRSLEASERLAIQASEAKTDFLATMSHELRTPVAGVVGFVELLEDTPLTSPQLRYLERIRTGVEHLQVVIGDVLDVSRIEAGGLTLHAEPTDLRDLVNSCVGLIQGQLRERVTVSALLDPEVPVYARVDSGRLRQVLMNLLSNAAKFTQAGAIVVHLRPTGEEGWCELLVRDSGCGIPADELDKVLERFNQSSQSLSRSHGGTGLGLPISKHLVEAMGGTFALRSTVGLGTVVTLGLKLEACGPPLRARVPELARLGPGRALSLRVLVVEDDPVLNELVVVQLERLGCEVLTCTDPKAAASLVEQGPLDLLISDLHMPGLDGFSLLRRIRRLQPELPALLMTADATLRARQIAQVAGFQRVLVKPVTQAVLHEALKDSALFEIGAASDHSVVDVEVLGSLTGMMGGQELLSLLQRSMSRIEQQILVLNDPDVGLKEMMAIAHQMRGTAGSLGFSAVQGKATLLQDAAGEGHTLIGHLEALEEAVQGTRAWLDRQDEASLATPAQVG